MATDTKETPSQRIARIKALAEKAKSKLTLAEYVALVAVIRGTVK
jgi:hypothetical protein